MWHQKNLCVCQGYTAWITFFSIHTSLYGVGAYTRLDFQGIHSEARPVCTCLPPHSIRLYFIVGNSSRNNAATDAWKGHSFTCLVFASAYVFAWCFHHLWTRRTGLKWYWGKSMLSPDFGSTGLLHWMCVYHRYPAKLMIWMSVMPLFPVASGPILERIFIQRRSKDLKTHWSGQKCGPETTQEAKKYTTKAVVGKFY